MSSEKLHKEDDDTRLVRLVASLDRNSKKHKKIYDDLAKE